MKIYKVYDRTFELYFADKSDAEGFASALGVTSGCRVSEVAVMPPASVVGKYIQAAVESENKAEVENE
jgi:hypothetical protein